MPQSIRVVLASVLGTIGVLGTMMGPARARPGAGAHGRNGRCARAEAVADVPGGEVGHDGLRASVELRIRRLVVEQLGVDAEELVPEGSLTDELAADSLDLAELVVVMESEFGIEVSPWRINGVRTYGDLVDAVFSCLDRHQPRPRLIPPALLARSRIAPTAWEGGGSLERAEQLTPYALQLIQDDAARARPGARLELTLPTSAAVDDVTAIQNELARLGGRGIEVSVCRDAAWDAETIAEEQPGRPGSETG